MSDSQQEYSRMDRDPHKHKELGTDLFAVGFVLVILASLIWTAWIVISFIVSAFI